MNKAKTTTPACYADQIESLTVWLQEQVDECRAFGKAMKSRHTLEGYIGADRAKQCASSYYRCLEKANEIQPTNTDDTESASSPCSSVWLKPGENEILKFYRSTPRGIDELDEWDQVATVLGYLSRPSMSKNVDVMVATDALAELQPAKREFWLRVGATYHDNFNRTLIEMLKE